MTKSFSQYTITLDDDSQIHKLIARITKLNSLPFTSPDKLMARAGSYKPTAVFVDIHLDVGVSGLDYLSEMRRIWPFVPIFVITSDPKHGLIGKALASGANDFIRKPLAPEEVRARLEARLTEMQEKQGIVELELNDIVFNARLGTIRKGDKIVHLPPLETELMLYLARNLGLKTTKQAIRQHLWGDTKICSNALDKKISNLRKAIKECASEVQVATSYGGSVALQLTQNKEVEKIAIGGP